MKTCWKTVPYPILDSCMDNRRQMLSLHIDIDWIIIIIRYRVDLQCDPLRMHRHAFATLSGFLSAPLTSGFVGTIYASARQPHNATKPTQICPSSFHTCPPFFPLRDLMIYCHCRAGRFLKEPVAVTSVGAAYRVRRYFSDVSKVIYTQLGAPILRRFDGTCDGRGCCIRLHLAELP